MATGDFGSAGGLVGSNDSGTISACYATGAVSGVDVSAGGLAGYNGGTITNCYATGVATASGVNGDVGGLLGFDDGTDNKLIL